MQKKNIARAYVPECCKRAALQHLHGPSHNQLWLRGPSEARQKFCLTELHYPGLVMLPDRRTLI